MESLSAKASRLVLATLAHLRPSPETPLAEWIESHVRLPEGLSAVPGPMKLWPYQNGIANAIGDPRIERVVLVKAARIGFTSLLTAALANWTSNDPQAVFGAPSYRERLPRLRRERFRTIVRGERAWGHLDRRAGWTKGLEPQHDFEQCPASAL